MDALAAVIPCRDVQLPVAGLDQAEVQIALAVVNEVLGPPVRQQLHLRDPIWWTEASDDGVQGADHRCATSNVFLGRLILLRARARG